MRKKPDDLNLHCLNKWLYQNSACMARITLYCGKWSHCGVVDKLLPLTLYSKGYFLILTIFSIFRQHWKKLKKIYVKFWILLKRANAPFSIIFSNTWYFKGVKMRYYGVKLVNQGSQVQSPASPVYQMRPEAVASWSVINLHLKKRGTHELADLRLWWAHIHSNLLITCQVKLTSL